MGKAGAMTEWSKTKKYNPSGPGYPEAGEYYVLMSEAEEKIEALEAEVKRLRRENDIMHHNVNEHLRVADKWKARFEGLTRDVSDLPSVPLDAPAEGRAILMEDISSMLAKLKKEDAL